MSNFKVLLYYFYNKIDDPTEYTNKHKKFCSQYDLKGRILISYEGLNGTISGPNEHCIEYMKYVNSDERFINLEFKIDDCTQHLFPKMSIKLRNEIVRLGENHIDPNRETGIHITPTEFYNMMDSDDSIILDVRSNYEHNIGKFKNAITFDIDTFRELPEKIKASNFYNNKNNFHKKILTYCTGGIKCEKASSLLIDLGYKNVYQLHGGIINYGKKKNGENFDGLCYVFDNRITKNINTINPIIITNCYLCNKKTNNLLNCKYPKCNKQTTICKSCHSEYYGCCSIKCMNIIKTEETVMCSKK